MDITIADIIVWLIVGMLAGSLVGALVKRRKTGYGRYTNFGIGLVGALVGGALFDLLNLSLGLENISISLQDIVAASIGSLLFLGALYWLRNRRGKTNVGPGA